MKLSVRRCFRSLSLIATLSVALIMSSILVRSSMSSPAVSEDTIDKVVSIAGEYGAAGAKVESFVENVRKTTRGMKVITSAKRESVLDEVEDVVNFGDVDLHVTQDQFPALAEAQVAELATGEVLATIPIKGDVAEPSNITAIFNENGELESLNESLFRPVGKDSGRLTMWRDGELVFDMMADSDGNSWEPNSAPPEASDQIELVNSQWWHFNKCLTQAGVSQWAITLIGIACGVACAATLGAGCIVCLGAAGIVASSTIGFCAGRAKQHLPK
ncbi:conserved exported hypothetical protein [metagenome]|uniref:Uncharacterized protein n=1 Tax=metagenome TaxID=256318 RepID=A0A2P2C834_9ZZZZ